MWGLSFERTEITVPRDGIWSIDGVLRALFSPSSSIEKPYDTSYTDVEVRALSEDRVIGRERIGTVSLADGDDSASDCIDTLTRTPFSITVDRPPTRITADCAEFADLCDHGDEIREYKYQGTAPETIESVDFEASPWEEWTNRKRPCTESSLSKAAARSDTGVQNWHLETVVRNDSD